MRTDSGSIDGFKEQVAPRDRGKSVRIRREPVAVTGDELQTQATGS